MRMGQSYHIGASLHSCDRRRTSEEKSDSCEKLGELHGDGTEVVIKAGKMAG